MAYMHVLNVARLRSCGPTKNSDNTLCFEALFILYQYLADHTHELLLEAVILLLGDLHGWLAWGWLVRGWSVHGWASLIGVPPPLVRSPYYKG